MATTPTISGLLLTIIICLLQGSHCFQICDSSISTKRQFRRKIVFVRFGTSSADDSAEDASNKSSRGSREIAAVFDVSDLGLTMDDLNAPLPSELLQSIVTTGYESTSRIPGVQDNACSWTEQGSTMAATLTIPGLRGQPPACLSVLVATNTLSITAFGQVVWSCILRGDVLPETASFECQDGSDMIPVIQFSVDKTDTNDRWGGFILQIGEDSIL